jgi:hypothetical protein
VSEKRTRFSIPLASARAWATFSCSIGEGDGVHLDAALLGQGQGQAAPAAADLHHRLAGLGAELGVDVPLLGELGLLQRHVRPREVGAGVLHVLVEEAPVEVVREVVVVGDVALGLDAVVWPRAALAPPAAQAGLAGRILVLGVGADQSMKSAISPCSSTRPPSM